MTVGFSSETESATGRILLKWNVKDLEIRTRSVEMSLAPLVIQVTTLVNSKRFSSKKKGKSKKVQVLVAAVQRATEKFVEHGEEIANENPEIQKEMLSAVEEVRKTGETMVLESREFAEDPTSTQKREKMVLAARNLLSAVTRLLILADMVDVSMILKYLRVVESDLDNLKTATSQEQVLDRIQAFGRNATELMQAAARRQQELRDHLLRDDLASARALLRKHSTMLLTASKVYVRHPELAAAKANRDFVLHQVCEAVNTISDVAQGRPGVRHIDNRPGELATALDEFDKRVAMEPLQSGSVQIRTRQALEEQLEAIIRGAAVMADLSSTRDDRRDRIVTECNALRMALQDLLTECISNAGKGDKSNKVDQAIAHLGNKTSDLRRQLRKTVADHVSDSFLDTGKPLQALMEAAKAGNREEVEECGKVFAAHAGKLGEVANLVCSMSTNEDGVKMVRYAVAQIQNICPQVVNAARILAAHPNSKVALENMEVFRKFWETQVRILTDAVDDITSIDDYLAVSETHMLEDLNRCLLALEEEDGVSLNRTWATITGRSNRLVNVVSGEMSIYESGFGYVERVIEALKVFRDQAIPNFSRSVAVCTEALAMKSLTAYGENDFIDASRLVYDGLREIRRAVLMNRADDELDPEEIYFDEHSVGSSTLQRNGDRHVVEEYADISGGASEGQALLKMTEEDKKRIAQEVKSFHTDKLNFDREVSKWDDTGNDIIVIAKQMSMIIMQMTDFTRGRGPLKTTMHVISAAQKISEFGTRLDKLAGQIAAQCPESSTKNDLLAYLQRIALHCHQLNITSKVKADVQSISGEVIVSGLDSATSLIQAAKNLMNAVVLTVKASYVASTKYSSHTTQLLPSVVWKMKAPEKKPLVRREKPDEVRAIVRRGSQKNRQTPMQALSEFQSPAESV